MLWYVLSSLTKIQLNSYYRLMPSKKNGTLGNLPKAPSKRHVYETLQFFLDHFA